MLKSKTKLLQLFVTLSACAFLLVPTILSVMAGLTANYFKGISSGLTLKWVYQVWELYADSTSPRVVVATVGRIYLVAIGRAWFGTRFGIAATIRLYERLSSLMDVYSGRACAVHVALHGAFDPGCSCRNGFENS